MIVLSFPSERNKEQSNFALLGQTDVLMLHLSGAIFYKVSFDVFSSGRTVLLLTYVLPVLTYVLDFQGYVPPARTVLHI